jgi:hypothetical protein
MKKIYFFLLILVINIGVINAEWKLWEHKDKITNEITIIVSSSSTEPDTKLEFPYSDVVSSISFACNSDNEYTYLSFSNLNLNKGKVDFSNDKVRTYYTKRVKWGDDVDELELYRVGNIDALYPKNSIIEKYSKYNDLLLELDWFNQGLVYFNYSLKGATQKITEAREICKNLK